MTGPEKAPDPRNDLLEAARWMATADHAPKGGGVTSDLSIDEGLLLHSASFEAVELVFGESTTSIPAGVWRWGVGELSFASDAHNRAVETASRRISTECARAHGQGVVGVRVEIEVHPHHVDVELVGTAVRKIGSAEAAGRPFVSGLSARDFVLLNNAGWLPVGLAFGTSFIYAPRRTAGTAIRQSTQNVELTNLTEALYSARESAMERMQDAGRRLQAHGIVGVKVVEGPISFSTHVMGFSARGTAVALQKGGHVPVVPQLTLGLDDQDLQFEAESLRGG
ncbi:MAG: heavy metal-binding domain-containing protein [Acidimicrobiales bacterium]